MPISYTKRGWTNNSPPAINAANLGAMDDGIKQACDGVDALNVAPVAHAARHKHGGSDEVATASPAANAIPKADGSGKLDSWVSDATTSAKGKVQLATSGEVASGKAVQGNDNRLIPGADIYATTGITTAEKLSNLLGLGLSSIATLQVGGTTYSAYSVVYVGSGVILVGTTNGKVLRSTDYGYSWSVALSHATSAYMRIFGAEYSTTDYFVLNSSSTTAYKSTDGGATWSSFTLPTSASRSFIAITASIWLVGDWSSIYRTIDGGANWSSLASISSIYGFGNIDGVIYCQVASGNIYRSTDNGASFSEVPSSYLAYQIETYKKIGSTIFAFGYNSNNKSMIIKSTDNGSTWATVASLPYDASYTEGIVLQSVIVHPTNSSIIYTGTSRGKLYGSYDAGTTWRVIATVADVSNSLRLIVMGTSILGFSGSNILRVR